MTTSVKPAPLQIDSTSTHTNQKGILIFAALTITALGAWISARMYNMPYQPQLLAATVASAGGAISLYAFKERSSFSEVAAQVVDESACQVKASNDHARIRFEHAFKQGAQVSVVFDSQEASTFLNLPKPDDAGLLVLLGSATFLAKNDKLIVHCVEDFENLAMQKLEEIHGVLLENKDDKNALTLAHIGHALFEGDQAVWIDTLDSVMVGGRDKTSGDYISVGNDSLNLLDIGTGFFNKLENLDEEALNALRDACDQEMNRTNKFMLVTGGDVESRKVRMEKVLEVAAQELTEEQQAILRSCLTYITPQEEIEMVLRQLVDKLDDLKEGDKAIILETGKTDGSLTEVIREKNELRFTVIGTVDATKRTAEEDRLAVDFVYNLFDD